MSVRRKTRKPAVPKVITQDAQLNKFAAALHELTDIWAGNKNQNDKMVTFGDLVDSGGFTIAGASGTGGSDSTIVFDGARDLDESPPSKVQNVVVSAGLTSVFITWDALSQTNISYYEIWRNVTNTWDGTELRIATSVVPIYADPVGDTEKTYYYWVRGVNTSGLVGPIDATGLVGATAAVALTNLASGLTAVEIVSVLPTVDNFEGRIVTLTTESNQLYRYTAGAWNKEINGADLGDGTVNYGAIAVGAIRAEQIAVNAVTADAIAAGEVTADHMTVTKLHTISANMGSITAGSISINNKFIVDSNGNTTIQGTGTAHMVLTNNVLKVYDSGGTKRVHIGNLNG